MVSELIVDERRLTMPTIYVYEAFTKPTSGLEVRHGRVDHSGDDDHEMDPNGFRQDIHHYDLVLLHYIFGYTRRKLVFDTPTDS